VFSVLLALVPQASFGDDKKKDPDQIGDRDVSRGINFYSLEKEIALGRQLAAAIQRDARVVDDPVVAEYVNRIGQNLARNSDCKMPLTIKVLDSQVVNALSLPGGFLFVNTGVLTQAQSEAELAGVMAHEIAHIAARHGTRQATRAELANYATIPLIFMGGWTGYAIRQGANLAIPMGFLKFSRGFETEADMLGLQYLYKAGYDPASFVDFFERIQSLETKKPGTIAKVFSTHPMTDDRIKNTQKNIAENLKIKPEYVVNTSEFDQVKARFVAMNDHKKLAVGDNGKPQLRKRPGGETGPIEDGVDKPAGGKGQEDERPTLKRPA
jgi:predicted Zn-dependent protease